MAYIGRGLEYGEFIKQSITTGNGSLTAFALDFAASQHLAINSGATAPEWVTAVGGGPSLGTLSVIRTNAKTISENITFAGTENGMSAGPITIADSYTVTVANGSTWTIV